MGQETIECHCGCKCQFNNKKQIMATTVELPEQNTSGDGYIVDDELLASALACCVVHFLRQDLPTAIAWR